MRMQLRKLSLVVEIIACFLFSRFRTVWFRLFLMMYIRGTKFPRIMFPFIYASLIIKKNSRLAIRSREKTFGWGSILARIL